MSFYKFSKGKVSATVPNGVGDGSAYFDGTSGKTQIKDTVNGIPSGSNSFSVSVWFRKMDSTEEADLTSWGEPDFGKNLSLYFQSGNNITIAVYGSGQIFATYEVGKWHHVVIIQNDGGFTCYLDGVYVTTWRPSHTLDLSPTGLGIASSGSNTYNGFVKDVAIYNRALSQEEVTAIYNNQKITDGIALYIPLQYGKDDESIFNSKHFVYDQGILETSSGFDELGNPIRYRSAGEAKLSPSNFINKATVFALDSNKGDTELVNNLTPNYSNGSCLEDSTFKFDGNSKYVTYPTQGVSNLNLGTEPFTIEWDCSIGTSHNGTYPSFINMGSSWSSGCYIVQWQRQYSGGLSTHWNGDFGADCYPTTTFPQFNGDGLYHHIAITRAEDGLYSFWVDGTRLTDTYNRTLGLDFGFANLDFSYNRIDGGRLQYNMKHFRISKECLYTEDFNIPKWVGN